LPVEQRRKLLDLKGGSLSIRHQCDLLSLNRSWFYYRPVKVSDWEQQLMNRVDEIFTAWPFYGSRKIAETLNQEGWQVGRGRVRRLMKLLGLEAIYPKPRLSERHPEHKIYPYLLRGVLIERVDQVWSTDITYIRLKRGYMYLVAVIDWYSRYVLSWRLSNSLSVDFCLEALEEALGDSKPNIFNTDQGSQFTSKVFVERLLGENIKVSMDGRGRALDNVFVERLWRTVKYEDVYLKSYETVLDLKGGLGAYFEFYNNERIHQSLNYRTPQEIYRGKKK
jgi:putative transposase